jgi:protein gp37
MASKTSIEWTDSTWNPIRVRVKPNAAQIAYAKGYTSLVPIAEKMVGRIGQHCEHVSPGCEHCYAESNNHRCLPGNGTGLPYDRRSRDLVEAFIDEKILLEPLRWRAIKSPVCGVCQDMKNGEDREGEECTCNTRPRRIFPMNQSDLFAEWVTDAMRDRVFAVMALCPGSIFQVLTKRIEAANAYLSSPGQLPGWRRILIDGAIWEVMGHPPADQIEYDGNWQCNWPLPNMWLGVSVESDLTRERVRTLLKTPAAKRFISAEPLLAPLSLRWIEADSFGTPHPRHLHPKPDVDGRCCTNEYDGLRELDWVICGGESGAHSRPMHQQWARSLRDQCQAAGVPFFFKQWGAYSPAKDGKYIVAPDGHIRPRHETLTDRDCRMTRQTKKAAGALLDGREWKQFPEMTR